MYVLGDKGKIQKLVQMAWTFVNDRYQIRTHWKISVLFFASMITHLSIVTQCSLSTSLSLRKRPEILAIAHLNLAGKLANFDLKASTDSPSSKPWWYSFNKECQEQVVEGIYLTVILRTRVVYLTLVIDYKLIVTKARRGDYELVITEA